MQEKLVMLVADDAGVNRAALRGMFEQEYTVLEAENGQQALAVLRETRVDVVLLDACLPVRGGEEVLGQMKADAALREIPVIVKTSTHAELEVHMLELGADDFIFLPCEPAVLRNRVKNIVQRYVLRQAMLRDKIREEQHLSRVREHFITRVSKDIQGDVEAILALCGGQEEAQCGGEWIGQIRGRAGHLLETVESVLDEAGIRHEELLLHPFPFRLQEAAAELTETYAALCREKGIHFTVECCEMPCENLIGDCGRLKKVWGRLLEKAYQNTKPGGSISTGCRQRTAGKGQVELEITVRGKLNPKDGFPVTKSIVELLRGTMRVEDTGDGGRFTVVLPFRVGREPVANKKRLAHMKVLILDDNELTRGYYAAIFSRLGTSCATLANWADAVGLLRRAYAQGRGCDLCFVNWQMPGSAGVVRELRAMYAPEHMLIVSAADEKGDMEVEMKAAGVDYVLQKPIYQSDIYHLLTDICGGGVQKNADA